MAAHVLENALLQVTVLPESGGKISSLRSLRTGEEFLLAPLQPNLALTTEDRATIEFNCGDLGGFDECLPSVAPCGSVNGEPPVPDHGDLWRYPWTVEASSPQSITLSTSTSSRPLRFLRTAKLEDDNLILDYEIENTSNSSTSWLWSAHPLLKVEAGDRIYLPPDITTVHVDYSATNDLIPTSSVQWPITRSRSGSSIDLSTVPLEDGVTAYKLFARMGATGVAALYRSRLRQGIAFHFDPAKLMYLGLWMSAGAWPHSNAVRQYAVALEPTTSSRDSLADAVADESFRLLSAGERITWRVVVQLLGAAAPCSFPASIDLDWRGVSSLE